MAAVQHEVHIVTVPLDPARGVLVHRTATGLWGFPGGEDLVAGENWTVTQRRGLARDLGAVQAENVAILHLESFPAGVVGPNSKFGVFVLAKVDASSLPPDGLALRWCSGVHDLDGLELVHALVRDLVVTALRRPPA